MNLTRSCPLPATETRTERCFNRDRCRLKAADGWLNRRSLVQLAWKGGGEGIISLEKSRGGGLENEDLGNGWDRGGAEYQRENIPAQ